MTLPTIRGTQAPGPLVLLLAAKYTWILRATIAPLCLRPPASPLARHTFLWTQNAQGIVGASCDLSSRYICPISLENLALDDFIQKNCLDFVGVDMDVGRNTSELAAHHIEYRIRRHERAQKIWAQRLLLRSKVTEHRSDPASLHHRYRHSRSRADLGLIAQKF